MKTRLAIAALLLLVASPTFAAAIRAYGQHVGGNIVYTYEVTNTGTQTIVNIAIGKDTDYIGSNFPTTRGVGEIGVFPVGSLDSDDILVRPDVPASLFSGPTGWTAYIQAYGHGGGAYLEFRPQRSLPRGIPPGQTLTFRITLPEPDYSYVYGHFSVRYTPSHATRIWAFNGTIEPLDITPPALSVTLSPTSLPPTGSSGATFAVTAAITVTDDYDPAPAIRLESITDDGAVDDNGVSIASAAAQNAVLGTDDRAFRLPHVNGITYEVTYVATDGSGTEMWVTNTITVQP